MHERSGKGGHDKMDEVGARGILPCFMVMRALRHGVMHNSSESKA